MGLEISYKEDTKGFNIWNTVTDEFIAEDVTRENARRIIMNREIEFADRYISDGCIVCSCGEDFISGGNRVICGGQKLTERFDSCSELASARKGISVPKDYYLKYANQNVERRLNNAQFKGMIS